MYLLLVVKNIRKYCKNKIFMPFESTICFSFNPIALRKAKIVCNFGLSECNWVHDKEKNPLKCMSCLPFSFPDEKFDQIGEKKV